MPVEFLRLTPGRSLMLSVFLVTIHLVAGLSVIPLTLAPVLKLRIVGTVVASLFRLGAIHGWKTSSSSVVELTLDQEGNVTLVYHGGECCQGMLRPDTYVHPLGVIVRVASTGGEKRSVVLLRGQLETGLFRSLRISLLKHRRERDFDAL